MDPPCPGWPGTLGPPVPPPLLASRTPGLADRTWTLDDPAYQTCPCQSACVNKIMSVTSNFSSTNQQRDNINLYVLRKFVYYLCFIFFHRIEWLFILTWTSWRILWEHPRIHHYGSWPGSVAPDCAASSFLTDPADPTAALAQLCYALCIWNQATNVNV